MIIVYRKSDGKVMNNHNTNLVLPEGNPGVEIANTINCNGGSFEDYGYFSLHDINDIEIVEATRDHIFTLEFVGGKPIRVIVGDKIIPPEPVIQSPTLEEKLNSLWNAQSETNATLLELMELTLGGM